MKKLITLMIAATLAVPLFGMGPKIIPLSATTSDSTNIDNNNVIKIRKYKADKTTLAYSLDLNITETEPLTTAPFTELLQATPTYKLACIVEGRDEDRHVYAFDAESLNAAFLHNNNPWIGFKPRIPYKNPLTRTDIADVDYFEINNQTCTYKFSYNDFVTNGKSLAEWNAYFPHNRIINGVPRDLEGQVVAQRTLCERVRDYINDPANRTRVYAGIACTGLTGLSVIAGSMALLSHHT